MTIRRTVVVDRHAGTAGEMKRIHCDGFHRIECDDVIESDVCTLGDAAHFIHILRVTFFGKRQIFARLNLRALPGKLKIIISGIDQNALWGQSGADIKVSYTYDTKTWGVISARTSAVYLNEYVIQSLPTDTPFDYAGSYSGTSLYARYRFYTQLGWSYKGWDAGLNNTYIPGVEDVAGGAGAPDVAAYSTWDARLGYSFKGSSNRWLKGLSIGAGVKPRSPAVPSCGSFGRDSITMSKPPLRFVGLVTVCSSQRTWNSGFSMATRS